MKGCFTMKKRKLGAGEIVFQTVTYAIFTLIALTCAYPFYYIFMYTLSDPIEAMKSNGLLLPVGFTLSNYKSILSLQNIYTALLVSVVRVVVGTALGVFMTSMFAYVLTQKEMIKGKLMYRITVASIYLNAGLIPWYITMKSYGLKDNFLLYILPSLISAFNLILVKTYIEQLPLSLQESALIDGAGHFTIFTKIIFPICKPVIAAIVVFSAVNHWNSWVDNFYLVNNAHLQTIQLVLLNYMKEADNIVQSVQSGNATQNLTSMKHTITPMSVRMTLTMFVTLPILLVYPFMQKYFIKGMLLGAVKG
jgi:ABC-type glycerol-3-phosphate transport system permease component